MAITGHKIFWSLSPDLTQYTTDAVHPVNSLLNSPIDVSSLPGFDIGNPNGITLPDNFWDSSFLNTGVYLRIAAYDGATIVSMSKITRIIHFGKSFTGVGQYFPFAMPLNDGGIRTARELASTIESGGLFFKTASGAWKFTSPSFTWETDDSPIMDAMVGIIFSKPADSGTISWIGKGWGE